MPWLKTSYATLSFNSLIIRLVTFNDGLSKIIVPFYFNLENSLFYFFLAHIKITRNAKLSNIALYIRPCSNETKLNLIYLKGVYCQTMTIIHIKTQKAINNLSYAKTSDYWWEPIGFHKIDSLFIENSVQLCPCDNFYKPIL